MIRVPPRRRFEAAPLVSFERQKLPTQEELVGIERGVFLGKSLELFRQLIDWVNRVRCANRHTSAAVDAADWVDVQLSGGFECGFVFLWMNAVGRAGINAEQILDALVGYHVSHEEASIYKSSAGAAGLRLNRKPGQQR